MQENKNILTSFLFVIALASAASFSASHAVYAIPNEVNNRINYCYTFDYIEVSTGDLHTNAIACGETKFSCEENRQQTAATGTTTTVKVIRVDDSCVRFKEYEGNPNNPK